MDHKPLPIGIENFEKMIKNGYYYIDKTLFIKELIDKKGEVNLFTRPRRFGKSLTMSMLRYFFEKSGNSGDLFNGLNISYAGEKYMSEMNKYPVISLTLKSAGQRDYKSSFLKLKQLIIRELKRHKYLLESANIDDIDKSIYINLLTGKVDDIDYSGTLSFLSDCLHQHHGEKVIILIDEYDVPLEKAYFNGYYDEMIDFLRAFYNEGLKTNESLYFAVMTGCLRVSRESIFTGFNNPKIITIMSNAYGEYFGFVDGEVMEALNYYGLDDKIDEARKWYNGYVFGETNVYNPWSVINYLCDKYEKKNSYPRPHWSNTSSNDIIRELINIAGYETKEEIEALIRGESITKPIHEDVVYGEIKNNMDNLWNFLFFTGYLRKTGESMKDIYIYYTLAIPNLEILYIYKRKIKEWFEEKIKSHDFNKMHEAVLNADTQTFQ